MEIDPFAAQESDADTDAPELTTAATPLTDDARIEKKRDRLNTWVAITVALLATFTGICKVKDDNIVQAMQQAQADKLDHWAFYQARNLREELAKATLAQLRLQAADRPPERRVEHDKVIAQYEKLATEQ